MPDLTLYEQVFAVPTIVQVSVIVNVDLGVMAPEADSCPFIKPPSVLLITRSQQTVSAVVPTVPKPPAELHDPAPAAPMLMLSVPMFVNTTFVSAPRQ